MSLRAALGSGLLLLLMVGIAHAEDTAEELAKKLSNPVAAMISVPLQYNYDTGLQGPQDRIPPSNPQAHLGVSPDVRLWHFIPHISPPCSDCVTS